MVRNATGEKRVLEVTKSVKEARDRAAAIEADFKTLGMAQWCERYDVPDVLRLGVVPDGPGESLRGRGRRAVPFPWPSPGIEVVGGLGPSEKRARRILCHRRSRRSTACPNRRSHGHNHRARPGEHSSARQGRRRLHHRADRHVRRTSTATKKVLYSGLCSALTSIGVPLFDILITIVESPTENWGVERNTPASEVDLGFQVDI